MLNEKELLKSWINSPIAFVKSIWGLSPQPLICEKNHEHIFSCYGDFIRGEMITWQQHKVLLAVEKAMRGEAPKRISVVTGHGIGKTALLSWLIHWFLFTRFNSQIGCTAPTSDQIYDIGWKELAVWNQRLPADIKKLFEWSTTHYKITEAPQTWWARARTARKESPEAFAGLHGDNVMLIADEASGVADEIYRVGEGSLTNKDTLVVLVGNGTRLEGYFYDTHNVDKANWQNLSFDSRESPVVEPGFAERIKNKYGEESDEFRFMVQGLFPKIGQIIDGNWMPLLSEQDLNLVADIGGMIEAKLGVDPSGEGSNKTAFVVRDNFRAKVAKLEDKSNPKGIAESMATLSTHYSIPSGKITVDAFGVGANVSQEYALALGERVQAINVGEKADDPERFTNKRSENYWRLREWIMKGGQLVKHPAWKQLLTIYYKRNLSGKIQIMSKDDMYKKHGWESPDVADALSLCFNKEKSDGSTTRAVEGPSNAELAELANIY